MALTSLSLRQNEGTAHPAKRIWVRLTSQFAVYSAFHSTWMFLNWKSCAQVMPIFECSACHSEGRWLYTALLSPRCEAGGSLHAEHACKRRWAFRKPRRLLILCFFFYKFSSKSVQGKCKTAMESRALPVERVEGPSPSGPPIHRPFYKVVLQMQRERVLGRAEGGEARVPTARSGAASCAGEQIDRCLCLLLA